MDGAGKYIEFITTRIKQTLRQKKFKSKNSVQLKYLFEKNRNSHCLIVVFSACTRKGIKARYNYVRTLKSVKCNKLFILDDFAQDHRGAYYLGKNGGNEIEMACKELIEYKAMVTDSNEIILCGSSKGGWAALNLMTDIDGSIAIVGAPQYLLANYLLAPALLNCRKYIMPDVTENNVNRLNQYLKIKLQDNASNRHIIYLHYSDSEHTYDEHVKFLIEDLENFGYKLNLDCRHYTDHWDVSKFFPEYLIQSIENCRKGERT